MFISSKKLSKTHFDFALSCFATFCKKIVVKRAPFGRLLANQTNLLFLSKKSKSESQKMPIPTTKLNNDVEMPIIGFGTWRSPCKCAYVCCLCKHVTASELLHVTLNCNSLLQGKSFKPIFNMPANDVTRLVKEAIDVGYRHIDCADIYGNQKEVGLAIEEKIKEGVVARKDLFITGKLWNTKHDPKLVGAACQNALNLLKITYFDNYLIHWPTGFADSDENYPKDKDGNTIFSDIDYVDTWCAMETLVDQGLCRSIGVSNFNIEQLQRVLDVARIKPANLQVECHPYLNQNKLMDFCSKYNIVITAYSPLGSPHSPYDKPGTHKLLQHPLIVELAQKYQRAPALILLRYQVQRGNAAITMSTKREHMADNLDVCNFKLTDAEMFEINGLNFNGRYNLMQNAKGHPHHPFENEKN